MNRLHIPGRLWRRGSAELTEVRRRVNFGLILLLVALFSPGGGQAQEIKWTKYDNGIPVNSDLSSTNGKVPLAATAGRGDDTHALIPVVIKDGSTYKMWYTGHDTYKIYYATSTNDGLTWTKYDNTVPPTSDGICTNGKIPLGSGAKGDASYTWYQAVIKDGSTYKMWYTGFGGGIYNIYYATSTNDGLTWTKYDNNIPAPSNLSSTNGKLPIGTSGGGRGDYTYVLAPSVIKDGSVYKMWYAGSGGGTICVYYATSSNGLEWTKYDNTIPENSDGASTNGKIPRGSSGRGDSRGASAPCVIKDGATYKMWYAGSDDGNTARVYYATSPDGLTWTKYDNTIPSDTDTINSNGRLGRGTAGKGDNIQASHPHVVVFDGQDGRYYQMWYSGYDGTSWRIYHATALIHPAGTIFTFR